MQNRLAKQAYFIKRLRDSGYRVDRLFIGYTKTDPRIWTIVINPATANILCTCYVNNGEAEGVDPSSKCFFELFDGGQYIPGRLKLDTGSIETIITYLMQYGVEPVNKSTKVSAKPATK